jgi:hypothetical protein
MELASDFTLQYIGHTQCNVCDTTIFKYNHTGLVVRYHKGLQNTMLPLGDGKYEINDIIIRQDGEIFTDWSFNNSTALSWWGISGEKEKTNNVCRSSKEEKPSYTCGGWSGCFGGTYSCGGGAIGGCGGAYSSFRGYSCGGGSSCG